MGTTFVKMAGSAAVKGKMANVAGSAAGKAAGMTAPAAPTVTGTSLADRTKRFASNAIYENAKANTGGGEAEPTLSKFAQGQPVPVGQPSPSTPSPYRRSAGPAPSPLFKTDDNGTESIMAYSDYLSEALDG
jgi:hypothetical protein